MPKKTKKKKRRSKISRKMKPIQSVINQVRNNYNNFIMYEEEDWRNNIMKQEEQEYIIQQYINKIIRRLETEERWKREDEEKALRIYLDKLQEEKEILSLENKCLTLNILKPKIFYNLYTVDHKITYEKSKDIYCHRTFMDSTKRISETKYKRYQLAS